MSIDYTLAKELKDAGWDQDIADCYLDVGDISPAGYREDWSETVAAAPTLSELIEACGKQFKQLVHTRKGNGHWSAVAHKRDGNHGAMVAGEFPEEAVARLWLALRTKE